jgi:hypothetical protein
MARPFALPLAFALVVSPPLAAPARADIPWPADGAPVCTAPGDQTGLIALDRFCVEGMAFGWFQRAASGDSLNPFGGFGVTPPAGGCNTALPEVPAGLAAGALSTSRLSSGLVLGVPGCFDPTYPGYAWVGLTNSVEQVLVDAPTWIGHNTLAVVHSGIPGTQGTPVLAGCGAFGFIDTAVVVVWADLAASPVQLRAQRISWQGALEWGGPDGIALAPVAAAQGAPRVQRMANGSTLVVWTDARSGSLDTYALLLLANGTPAPGWPATGLALEARAEDSESPRILGDPYGPFFVCWEERGPRFGGTAHTSIVVRRLLSNGLPDPAWSDSGVVVTTSATVERLDDVQLDFASGLAVVWTDTRAASIANPTDVYGQRILSDGTRPAGWPAAGLALCTATGRQDHARVSVLSDGSAVFAWEDQRDGDHRVYATLRSPEGQMPCCNWLPDGTPATQSAGDQRNPVVRAGNGGGGFVTWEDGRDLATNGYDIYAQAFTSDGRNADVGPQPPIEIATLRDPAPNPSRGLTRLRLELPRGAHVRVDVYDIVGRHVHTVAEGTLEAGLHEWRWAGTDDTGRLLPAGLYHLRARVDGVASSRTIVRLR